MQISVEESKGRYRAAQQRSYLAQSRAPHQRTHPRLFHYDYLHLSRLHHDLKEILQALHPQGDRNICVDVGGGSSPYQELLKANGWLVVVVDPDPAVSPDRIGSINELPFDTSSVDLILCTQVLEHTGNPWRGVREISRVLRPGGVLVCSVPHVWFYHPHPCDNYRFTQEGVVTLCQGESDAPTGLVVEELRSQGGSVLCLMQVLCFSIFGILGRYGAPLYVVLNVAGGLLDRLFNNDLLCPNFVFRAAKKTE